MVAPTLEEILKAAASLGASDIHIIANSPPQIRAYGKLSKLPLKSLSSEEAHTICLSILTKEQKERFLEEMEIDFTFEAQNIGRFRVNLYFQKGSAAAALRSVPKEIPALNSAYPPIFKELICYEKGLILVTGPTGSGKSTTLAAMINEINEKEHKHVITIEDPIEFYHEHKNSIISQREVGRDTTSFALALKYALREDPDVIMVGETRDAQTTKAAVTAAETGHLVLATTHTNSAVSTINRIIDIFPSEERALVRTQLSMSLLAVISQALVPTTDGKLVAAYEILINNPAIANLIREDKIHQIYSQLQLGQGKTGMQTMSKSLLELVRAKIISKDNALRFATNKEEMERGL